MTKKELTKEEKTKANIRKAIYLVLFAIVIACFIYISNNLVHEDNDKLTITDYYSDIDEEFYEAINGTEMINKIKKGTNIIIIGSKTSDWSKKEMEIVTPIFKRMNIDKVYYYDINNDKAQKNSNYYKIKDLLEGYLTVTDGSDSNLLAPSIYIISSGKVKYYNTDTVAMKNTIEIDEYWDNQRKFEFEIELEEAIYNYYLN